MRALVIDADPRGQAQEIVAAIRHRGHDARHGDVTDADAFDLVVLVDAAESREALPSLCREARARHAGAFLLALLGAPWDDRAGSVLDAGLDDYSPLPFDPQRFDARLRVVERNIELRERRREALEIQSQLVLADRLVSVGTLAAGAAHEINNPLTYVIANLEFAARLVGLPVPTDINAAAESRARLRRALAHAREGADRVRQIVKNLRTFSRGDEDRRGPVLVEDVIESSIDMAWNEIRHRARLVREFGPVPAVIANEARLGQVFLNLLMNAAQAIPEGHVAEHRVRVVTREQGDRVVVEIIDTGAGIAPDVRERIFDPFFTTKPVGEGIGLGLSICHGIVANLGGEIQVESAPGRGSTFRVLLPASNRVRVDDPSRPPRTLLPPRRARVLLVDDEANLRTSLGQILGAEHEVREAASGAEVLELLRGGERYDVLLCDLMMPEMSGIDLFDAIERLDDAQARRVIFLTGGAFTPRAQEFMARVPNPRLEKPFDIDELLHMIRKVVP
jgi:two-component system cell cycle sensor histidine kinase/response regulator CckA